MHPTMTFELARQDAAARLEHAETMRSRARILRARHASDASRRPPDPQRVTLPSWLLAGTTAGTAFAR